MSNDNTAKPTPGPWAIEPEGDGEFSIVNREHNGDDWDICVVHSTEANASLIAEAGTVHHETGLTPRQLAEQRVELLRVVDSIRKDCRRGAHEHGMSDAGVCDIAKRCDAIIAKVEAKP